MDIAVILSFIFFMSIFAGVGLASVRVKKIQLMITWLQVEA